MPGYIIYARKSSESEDRQILSIDSQVAELKSIAARENVPVAGVLTEARSAKAPGRVVFSDLLRQVNRGAVQGVIAWKLDRLARNPVDGAALIWALEQHKLHEIVIPGRRFTDRGDDKFWMQLEFGMAKKYVDDLSDNVKRGNRAKLEMGWLPNRPPLGYLNDPVTRTIIPDPDRFPLIQRIWELVLKGEPPAKVYQLATRVWGLRSRVTKLGGGGLIAESQFYALLGNPFYCGLIVRKSETWAGAHTPAVSREEFDQVQRLMGRPNRVGSRTHEFAFTGLVRCGECGCSVTAEEKINRYGSHYTYYHCTRKKRGVPCAQRVISVQALEDQILTRLRRIRLPRKYQEWTFTHLTTRHEEESTSRGTSLHSLERTHDELQRQLSTLTDLRLRGVLPDEEFLTKREQLVKQEVALREARTQVNGDGPDWLELSGKAFAFTNQAEKRFLDGSNAEKREILVAMGSNLTLKDKSLAVSLHKPFLLGEEGSGSPNLWALPDQIRTFFIEHPHAIQWPKWCEEAAGKLKLPLSRRATNGVEVTR